MNEQEPIRVLLELDPGADDVLSGRIGFEGRILEFSGWLRLIAVIEAARRLPDADARPPPEPAVRHLRRRTGPATTSIPLSQPADGPNTDQEAFRC